MKRNAKVVGLIATTIVAAGAFGFAVDRPRPRRRDYQ